MRLSIVDRRRFLWVRRALIHSTSAWGRRAALVLGIFFACVGASAQVVADQTPSGIPSPLPPSVLQVAAPKLDLSAKAETNEKWNSFDRAFVLPTTALTP